MQKTRDRRADNSGLDNVASASSTIADTMSRSAIVRSSILADFRRVALALGLDPIALMKLAHIDRRYLDDPDLTLPVRDVAELFEIAALTSGVEDFGLRLGEARGLPDLGPIILMLREEATLRDALRTLSALLHLHSDALYMNLEEHGGSVLTVEIMVGGGAYCRQAVESTIAGVIHILRWLLGEDWVPTSIGFRHTRPISRVRYDRFFRCPIDFLYDFNGVVLKRRDLDRKLPASSPVLRRQVERYIRTINIASSDSYVHQVMRVVAMALPRGEGDAETIARYLGTDRRTLNRRLARAALNYSAVVENVRKNITTQYLLGSDRLLSDIAGLVGFESLRAFTRWFHRSFGQAPSSWRAKHRLAETRRTRSH
jgi:AraC-like DNA-binding protein